MPRFFGHDRDELYGSSAGADARHPLPGEVHFLLRPARGVKRLARKAVDPREGRRIPGGQDASRRDDKLRPGALPILQLDVPAIGLLIVDRCFDPRIELDVGAQVKLVCDKIEVLFVFRLPRKMFLPVPFL
jgi:hypothetical protein